MPRTDRALAVLLAAVTVVSRLPFRSRVLPTWDAVQFALAVREYDIAKHQPHPPGYVLYVGAARFVDHLVHDPDASLTCLSIAASALAVLMTYRLGWMLQGRATAVIASTWLATSPLFWLYGEVPLPYAVESALAVTVAALVWPMARGEARFALWSAAALGLAGGVRQSLLLLLGPLWLAMAWTGLACWRPILAGLAVMAVIVAAWLVPMLVLAGSVGHYLAAAHELYESTVRATSLASGGWPVNVRGLFEAAILGFGVLLPLVVWALVRGARAVRGWGRAEALLAGSIVPPFLVYACVHFGQYGYLLTVLPAALIALARSLVSARVHRARLVVLVAGTAAIHGAFFVAAPAVDVPQTDAGAPALARLDASLRGYADLVLTDVVPTGIRAVPLEARHRLGWPQGRRRRGRRAGPPGRDGDRRRAEQHSTAMNQRPPEHTLFATTKSIFPA